ncbi:CPBP family intramembrane metalloprotease, partial [archaeon]|nr:CPBP family intramembrane metalloprotease [archaeon]
MLLLDALLILFPAFYITKNKKKFSAAKAFKRLGFRKMKAAKLAKETVLLLAKLLALFLLVSFLFALINFNDLDKVYNTVKGFSLPLTAYFLIVRVPAEEVFFRGFLVQKIGVVYSTALFAVAHALYGSWVEVIGAFVLGLVLARAFDRTR